MAHAAEIVWTPETVEQEAWVVADEYDLGDPLAYQFVETMRRESKGFTVVDGQSEVIKKDGTREDSWGVCQIHLPDHPSVSKEEAKNPHWCLRWSAEKFRQGYARWWTEYRKLASYE